MVDVHARQAGARRWHAAPVVAVLLVAALVGGAFAAVRSGLVERTAARLPWASAPAPCPETDVAVVAAPEAVTVVDQILAPLEGRSLPDGSCLRVDVRSEAPSRSVSGEGTTATAPQVWVPDSSLWVGEMDRWPLRPVGSIGTSPVVLAGIPATVKRLGWRSRTPSWIEALTPDRRLAAPEMTEDAASLLALLSLARTIGPGPEAEQAVAALVLAAARTPAADLGAAAALARSRERTAPVLLTSRRAVVQLNLDPATEDLSTVRPTGVPAVLDYPVLRVAQAGEDPVVGAGGDLVAAALTTAQAARTAQAAGFGPPSRTVAPTTKAGRAAAEAAAEQVNRFVSRVRLQAVPSRMLILMDTSRSMVQKVAPGLSRARLASTAALGAGEFLPDDSAIGLWRFAGRQRGGRPYEELARVDELGALDQGTSHRDVVNAALARLPRQLTAGGTALYDSTLAAIRTMRATYDPSATNAVVVFTDGANDFDAGISLREFQDKARADARAHPRAPIVLVTIGIGAQADLKALKAMTAPVGGRTYRADTPAALQTVLFDAIANRTPGRPS
jgi:hypothetical protein